MTSKFFNNVSFINSPSSKTISLFSCDEKYFINYGIYNILSADKIKQDIHVNIINPTDQTFQNIELLNKKIKINFTYSFEKYSNKNWFALKSYYFCNRYFLAREIFKKTDVETIYITDADIIYKQNISFPYHKALGTIFNPWEDNLWKQTGGNFVFIKKSQKMFLDRFIDEFENRHARTNWSIVDLLNKIDRGNKVGLDQVCLSFTVKKYKYFEKDFFINLNSEKIINKNKDTESKIWSLTGGGQKASSELKKTINIFLK